MQNPTKIGGGCHPKHCNAHHVFTQQKVVVVVVCFELTFVRLEVDIEKLKLWWLSQNAESGGMNKIQRL